MEKLNKRYSMLCIVMMFVFFVNVFFWTPLEASASTGDDSIITGLTNTGNANLSFYLKVPAKTTARYQIKFQTNNSGQALQTLSGSVKNNENKEKKIKVSRTVGYYSSKYQYSVSANYNYKRKNYIDTDKVYCKIPAKTFLSNKFTWTEEKIKRAKLNKRVEIALVFGGSLALDILVTKGYCTKAAVTAYSIASFANDLVTAGASQDIRNSMIKGWGYRIKAVPNSSRTQYTLYLLTYNKDGKLVDTTKCGTTSVNPYCHVIK